MPDIDYQILSKAHLAVLKKYQQKKYRKQDQLVLLEGWNLVEQMIANGFEPLEVVTTEVEKCRAGSIQCPVYLAQKHEIEQLSDTESPQSIIALYAVPNPSLHSYRAILYLDGIQDPGNLGTIFRIALAFGFDGIVLSPFCCEVFSPKVIRASLGSVFMLPSIVGDVDWLSAQDAHRVGLDAKSETPLNKCTLQAGKAVILVIGSEGNGIRKSVLSLLDIIACIPISTKMESLNASVTAGIAAYEISDRLFLLT